MRLGIITTRQNYAWLSMQEVLPAIEHCWVNAAHESKIINVDEEPLRSHIDYLLKCDALIIIAFNETISRYIKNIRGTLNFQIPLVLHLYGHATLGCWPQHRFGSLEHFNEGDAFIGTCPGDLNCMKLSFSNAKTYNIPYPYLPIETDHSNQQSKIKFAFVGRISDQKNIHLLIEAYKILQGLIENPPELNIYGKEDFLGSPNMGISSSECLKDLMKLVAEYNLEQKVFFKGHTPREEIYSELGINHIFVSASTHSDENFGMAAMRSLSFGGMAILSDWGGHKEFQTQHPDRVWTAKVHFENNKPVIDPKQFSELMKAAILRSNNTPTMPYLSSYFSVEEIVKSFKTVLDELSFSKNKLSPNEDTLKIFKQQMEFEQQGNIQKTFSSYDDPIAQKYLKAYS